MPSRHRHGSAAAVDTWAPAVVLSVFMLHNAWNCWVFLNFATLPDVAQELIAVGDDDFALLTTLQWIGITVFGVIATAFTWYAVPPPCQHQGQTPPNTPTPTHAHMNI